MRELWDVIASDPRLFVPLVAGVAGAVGAVLGFLVREWLGR